MVELQSLGLMDRHDLDRVVVARLHRLPLLLVELLDRVDVVEERAQRELAFDGLERVDLVEERRQVARAVRGDAAVEVGVELVEDADAPDHLAQELGDGPARLRPELRQLVAELLEPGAALVGQALDLVEMLERLGEQERRLLVVAAIFAPARSSCPWPTRPRARGP